jgi:hypothetical protein
MLHSPRTESHHQPSDRSKPFRNSCDQLPLLLLLRLLLLLLRLLLLQQLMHLRSSEKT